MLQQQAEARPNDIAFTFLVNGEEEEENITFGELDRRARAIGAYLQATGKPLDRAVLLYGPGLDYIAAFFGCLYGGATAVTAYPPDPARLARTLPRLESIINDCNARVVLTTSTIMGMSSFIFELAPSLKSREWVATNELSSRNRLEGAEARRRCARLHPVHLRIDRHPQGSHAHARQHARNERSLQRGLEATPADVGVGWLPSFHDMGLIGGVSCPSTPGSSRLHAPHDFLQNPCAGSKP